MDEICMSCWFIIFVARLLAVVRESILMTSLEQWGIPAAIGGIPGFFRVTSRVGMWHFLEVM